MLIVISPAKTLDFQTPPITDHYTQPEWLNRSSQLIERLRQLSTTELAEMMKLSDKLATLNHQRYRDWHQPFTSDNAKQAVLAMKGDVYGGLELDWAVHMDIGRELARGCGSTAWIACVVKSNLRCPHRPDPLF